MTRAAFVLGLLLSLIAVSAWAWPILLVAPKGGKLETGAGTNTMIWTWQIMAFDADEMEWTP